MGSYSGLLLASVAAADAIMLGSVAQNSMTAVSLATQIQFVQNMILTAVVTAVSILGAQYWGKGDEQTVNDVFCIGLRYCGIVSVLFFFGCIFFPRYLMLLFTDCDRYPIPQGFRMVLPYFRYFTVLSVHYEG